MNLVQELQLCVSLSIIHETPKFSNPKEYAELLQKAIKELGAVVSAEDSKENQKTFEVAGNSRNAGMPRGIAIEVSDLGDFSADQIGARSTESKVPKIFVKPFRKLLPATPDCRDVIEVVSCHKSTTLDSSRNSIDTTLAPCAKPTPLETTTPKKRSLRYVPESSISLKARKNPLICSKNTMPSTMKRISRCLPRIKDRNIHYKVTKDESSSIGKISNCPLLNQRTQTFKCKENLFIPPIKQNEKPPSNVSKSLEADCSFQPSETMPQPSTHQVAPMPGEWDDLPSFLEEFGYRQYFIVAQDKTEVLMLILNDVLRVVRRVLLTKRTFSESAIEEMFQVINLSEANDAKTTLNLCIRFYTDVLKSLLNLHLQNDINFEFKKKVCDVVKKIFHIHWRYLEACGEKTTRFLCHLLELNAGGCFVDDIGFCVVDLLATIVANVNKAIGGQTASSDDMNLNLLDVALKVVNGDDPHLQTTTDGELEEDNNYLLVCVKRWKWMLQNAKQPSNVHSLFLMQVESLFQQMDRSTKQ